jgi:2'-5' RNA ligase/ribosomal protein S18 acetylase RimI-like enzyme
LTKDAPQPKPVPKLAPIVAAVSASKYVTPEGESPEDTYFYYRGTSASELKKVFEGGELGADWGLDFGYSSDFADGYAGGGAGAVMVADRRTDGASRWIIPDPSDVVALLEPHTGRILWEKGSGFKDKELEQRIGFDERRKTGERRQRRFSVVMVGVSDAAGPILKAGQQIPKEELGSDGYEKDPHITIKYGAEDDLDILQNTIKGATPFRVTLGKTKVFIPTESSDEQAPIVVEAHAPELKRLHELVDKAMSVRPDDFPYNPHVTLAYVKPEFAQKYEDSDICEGITFQVKSVIFSRRDRSKIEIPLKQKPTAVIITGDPSIVKGKHIAENFYSELAGFLESLGFEVSTDPGRPHTSPSPADLWVGHSRGADRLQFAPEETAVLGIGVPTSDDKTHFKVVNNPDDPLAKREFDHGRLAAWSDAHYELTEDMKDEIRKFVENQSIFKTAARAELIRSKTAFKFIPQVRSQDEALISVDVQKFEEAWKKDQGYYVGPGGSDNAIGGRYERFQKWLADNPGKSIEAPIVSWNEVTGCPSFTDGRHRFAVLRDMGVDKVYISVPKNQVQTFRKFAAKYQNTPQRKTVTASSKWFYHITFSNHLDGIASSGLLPGAESGITGPGDPNKVFITEWPAVSHWLNRAENWAYHRSDHIIEDGLVPVVIRFPRTSVVGQLEEDEAADGVPGAYKVEGVEPNGMQVWNSKSWDSGMYVDPAVFVDEEGYLQGLDPKTSSHKTPPLSDTQYENPEMGEETNAYAVVPERVKGTREEPALETLAPQLFKTALIMDDEKNEGLQYVGADEEDAGELSDQAYQLARKTVVNILSDKEPSLYALFDGMVVGALFISTGRDHFSFDVVVDPEFQGSGIGSHLVTDAENEFQIRRDAFGDDYQMQIDVINPKMKSLLENRGYQVTKDMGGRWMMTKKASISILYQGMTVDGARKIHASGTAEGGTIDKTAAAFQGMDLATGLAQFAIVSIGRDKQVLGYEIYDNHGDDYVEPGLMDKFAKGKTTGEVYLLHFNIRPDEVVQPTREDARKPFHARHYLGWAENAQSRIQEHRDGTGARLTQHLKSLGYTFEVAQIWNGESRKFERRLKDQGGLSRHCPICQRLGIDRESIAKKRRQEHTEEIAAPARTTGPDYLETAKISAGPEWRRWMIVNGEVVIGTKGELHWQIAERYGLPSFGYAYDLVQRGSAEINPADRTLTLRGYKNQFPPNSVVEAFEHKWPGYKMQEFALAVSSKTAAPHTVLALTPEARQLILQKFPPKFFEVKADHVTLQYGVPMNAAAPAPASVIVVGYASDDSLEALAVTVDGVLKRPDGKPYHITLSLDRSKGRVPADSGTLLAQGFEDIQPFDVQTQPQVKTASQMYNGGSGKPGRFVTYYTPNKDMAESYVEMYNDRYGQGGQLNETDIHFTNPAPWEMIMEIADSIGLDNESYTPASIFDEHLHGARLVSQLVAKLKQRGYDGAILDDIAYGKQIQDKAFVKFSAKPKPPLTKRLLEGIAWEVRDDLMPGRDAIDGDCEPISDSIVEKLRELGYRDAYTAYGQFEGEAQFPHAWVRVGDWEVDATQDQFARFQDDPEREAQLAENPVYVGKPRGWGHSKSSNPRPWSRPEPSKRHQSSLSKHAFKIEVPKGVRDHFWQEPPDGNLEFWAYRHAVNVLPGEKIVFTFDGAPVASVVCHHTEAPGQSKCENTGKYEKHHKVYWDPKKFKRLDGKTASSNRIEKYDHLVDVGVPAMSSYLPKDWKEYDSTKIRRCKSNSNRLCYANAWENAKANPDLRWVVGACLDKKDFDEMVEGWDQYSLKYDAPLMGFYVHSWNIDKNDQIIDPTYGMNGKNFYYFGKVMDVNAITDKTGTDAIMQQIYKEVETPPEYTDEKVNAYYEQMLERRKGMKISAAQFPTEMTPEQMLNYVDRLHSKGWDGKPFETSSWIPDATKYVLQTIDINDPSVRWAEGKHPDRAKQYAEMKTPMPPIVIGTDRKVVDGYHRRDGAKLRGDQTIPAYVGVKTAAFAAPMTLHQALESLRPQIVAVAQKIYDENVAANIEDPEFEHGICDEIAQEIQGVIVSHVADVEVRDGGQDGDDHAWVIAFNDHEAYGVDIPPRAYESGGGYSWTLHENVKFKPEDVEIWSIEIPTEDLRTAKVASEVLTVNGIPVNERHEYDTPVFVKGLTVLQGVDLPFTTVEFEQRNIKVENGNGIGITGKGADARDLSYLA